MFKLDKNAEIDKLTKKMTKKYVLMFEFCEKKSLDT